MIHLNEISAGNAKLQGLTTQLNLTGNKYNVALVRLLSRLFTTKNSNQDVDTIQTMYFIVRMTGNSEN